MRSANSSELDLYAHAQAAAVNAYAPYSHFPVGAALQPEGGVEPVIGVNVENASFGMTLCAERTAVFTAVTAGHRRFVAIAVYADAETASPCGACRQVLAEFSPDITVIFRRGGEVVAAALDELLPERFAL
jgi:cytidine deaminase